MYTTPFVIPVIEVCNILLYTRHTSKYIYKFHGNVYFFLATFYLNQNTPGVKKVAAKNLKKGCA